MTIGLLSEERRKLNREKQNIISDTSLRNSPKHSLALIDMPFMNLVIQDGPYCPKSCAHCHGNFGPNKPKADMRLYEEVMKQLPDTDIAHIIITDGEPFHNINRLEDILTVLDGMPVELNTSGEFAKTVEDAEKIFDRLSSAGLNF